MRLVKEDQWMDGSADSTDVVQVEVSPEVGGTFKLYVHVSGRTVLRICKLRREQFMPSGPLTLSTLASERMLEYLGERRSGEMGGDPERRGDPGHPDNEMGM